MPDFNIPTDPGEFKETRVEPVLRGLPCGEEPANFDALFSTYRLGNRAIYGTKADVINLASFMNFLRVKHGIEETVDEGLRARKYGSDDTRQFIDTDYNQGMFRAYWSNTSEVHHRDVMRWAYVGLRDAIVGQASHLEEMASRVANESGDDPNAEAILDSAIKLYAAADDISAASKILYAAKVGGAGVELSDTAKAMLRNAQGYQLSSVPKDDNVPLTRARLLQADLYSAITKEQVRQDVVPTAEEVDTNIRHFLDGFRCVSFAKISWIAVPDTHPTIAKSFRVESHRQHMQTNGNKGTYVASRQFEKDLPVRKYDIRHGEVPNHV